MNYQSIHNKKQLIFNKNKQNNESEQIQKSNIQNQQQVLNNYKTETPHIFKTGIYDDGIQQIVANSNLQKERTNYYLNNKNKEYVNQGKLRQIYDPIIEKQNKEGLLNNTSARLINYFLNIDSSNRRINSLVTYQGSLIKLNNNPIQLTKNSSKIYINCPNHNLLKEDKIELGGITKQSNNIVYNNINPNLIFLDYYIQINQKHNIDINSKDTFYCEITDFTNPNITNQSQLFVGNIPITFINNTHEIVLSDSKYNLIESSDYFYIKLPYKYIPSSDYPLSTVTRNYTLYLYYIDNIPIHKLNAKYPITNYASSPYHIVENVDSNGFFVNIFTNAYWTSNDENTKNIGGKNVVVRKIDKFENGYSEPNNYTIELSKIYKNIVAVELLSSEFPCVENIIYKNKSIKSSVVQGYNNSNQEITFTQNNKLYWQNYDDGNYTYSVEITPGKYTPITLAQEIYNQVYNTERIYYTNQTNVVQPYTNHNYIEVEFNILQDLVIFKSYVEYIMKYMLKGLYYQNINGTNVDNLFYKINNRDSLNTNDLNKYPLYVIIKLNNNMLTKNNIFTKNNNDQLIIGDSIILSGITSYYGISGTYLNNISFEIFQISTEMFASGNLPDDFDDSDNFFIIKLGIVNIDNVFNEQFTNSIFSLKAPNKFRLLFDTNDTIGNVLGFKNVGHATSITDYGLTITNKMNYKPDIGVIIPDDDINPGNAIQLSGNNYILIVCDQFPVIDNLTEDKNVFAKIQLVGSPGTIVYNSFVKTKKIYHTPINEINKLSFSFYSPNGELYDFNGLNHSFMIKITTLELVPIQTRISSQNESNV